ncbi:hypothetical protein [Hymenobacter wooponensis]|uniref:Killer suppression protein HigA n=1 Tax=Hymenobacter wooponensis TaxID=1525360 RepID=A0A4Z0MEP4_9BACT|nr:hypothetical protein [Hymenobacter wooponensis]TGD78232.1 hypothetical protein EU557_19155 [Hymenobacter wooponensis]
MRKICEDKLFAEEILGVSVAKSLQSMLSDLMAANNIFDLPFGSPTEILGSAGQKYQINLANGYKLLVGCNPIKTPTLLSGIINWEKVRKLIIIDVQG